MCKAVDYSLIPSFKITMFNHMPFRMFKINEVNAQSVSADERDIC
jgi:hypothetical protein